MKTSLLVLATILLTTHTIYAQGDHANLLVQSPDGKTVKLVWFINKWNNDITAFDVKRKEGLKDWVKLNTEPIMLGVSVKKKFSVINDDKAEESVLRAKLYKLLAAHLLEEIDSEPFVQQLKNDDKAVQAVSKMITYDYDVALIMGFGFVDHSPKMKTNYHYGVFIAGTDKLLANVQWNYGQIPDLNAVQEITARGNSGSNGILLMWHADMDKIRSGDIAGFNVYREGIRLNEVPVTMFSSKDPTEFVWNDASANGAVPIQYSVSAESVFGIEGIIHPYVYDPADHPAVYKQSEVNEIASLGFYFKDGINVKWSFPKEDQRFIKGFYIEKDNMPDGYKKVSGLIDPADRAFTDKSPSPVSGYIRFRVVAEYTDRSDIAGIEKLYSYFPISEPPAPQRTKAVQLLTDKKKIITLTWDSRMNGDSLTESYNVYAFDSINNKYSLANDKQIISGTKYLYPVKDDTQLIQKFYVTSVGRNKRESQPGDTVAVYVTGR